MMKIVVILGLMMLASFAIGRNICLGDCPDPLNDSELKKVDYVIKSSLGKLEVRSDLHYKLIKINSATKKKKGFPLIKVNADLEDLQKKKRVCNFELSPDGNLDDIIVVKLNCPVEVIISYYELLKYL